MSLELNFNQFQSSFIFFFLLQFIQLNEGITTSLSWTRQSVNGLTLNLPRPVLQYRSYIDVYPTRYDVPAGHSKIILSFQALGSKSCKNETIDFLVQQGGLPLVKQDNHPFPDNYVVPNGDPLHFELGLGQMVTFALLRPPPGPWFVIAYNAKSEDKKIRQKGLTSTKNVCHLSYVSSLQLAPLYKSHHASINDVNTMTIFGREALVSFDLPLSTYGFRVTVLKCFSPNCTLHLAYQPFSQEKELTQECKNADVEVCYFQVPSPELGINQLIYFRSENVDNVLIHIQISALTCRYSVNAVCLANAPLTRTNTATPNFANLGYFYSASIALHVYGSRIIVFPFGMKEPNDIGGTLSWKMSVSPHIFSGHDDGIEIHVCGSLLYNFLPDLSDESFDACVNLTNAAHVSRIGSHRNESTLYIPYPRVGVWHVLLQSHCFLSHNGSEVSCRPDLSVDMSLMIRPCIQDGCGGKGECLYRTIGSDLVTYSACRCYAGYRGYGCEDDSHALSRTVQLAGAFLLTMSNLLFLPSIIIATRRRFYVEAFVYTFTMVFSTFYHACDGNRINQYRLCIIPYDVLQAADFFGSSCSVWITTVAMAMINIRYITPFLQMLGPFGLFIGVVYDKTSLYVIAVPVVAGLLVIISSWGFKMYRRKKLYPSKRRYLMFLLPGIILATVAAVIYSFVETTTNYKYLHSMWHISIASAICFLLPPKNAQCKDDSKSDDVMMTGALTINSSEITDAESRTQD